MSVLAVAAICGLRVVSLLQLALALPASLAASESIPWNLAWAMAYGVESILIIWSLLKARSPSLPKVCFFDLMFMCALFFGQRTYVAQGDYYATWEAWAFGVSMSTVLFTSMAFSRYRQSLLGAFSLGASYLVAVGPDAMRAGAFFSVTTNAVGFLANVAVARFVWLYLARLAAEADRAKSVAAAEAAANERLQLQHLLHDNQRLLAVLSSGEISDEGADAYRRSARAAMMRMEAFLNDVDQKLESLSLAGMLRSTAAEFSEIKIVVNTLMVEKLQLSASVLSAIQGCVRTLIINAVRHASAGTVTVHGDWSPVHETWEVTVQDDGIGFDQSSTRLGFGLGNQIPNLLGAIEAEFSVLSREGIGTVVTLTGNLKATDPSRGERR